MYFLVYVLMILCVVILIIANLVGWGQRDEKYITQTDRNVYYTNISLLCFLLLILIVLGIRAFYLKDEGFFGFGGEDSSADNSGFAFG